MAATARVIWLWEMPQVSTDPAVGWCSSDLDKCLTCFYFFFSFVISYTPASLQDLQRPLSSDPKVAVVERIDCVLLFYNIKRMIILVRHVSLRGRS